MRKFLSLLILSIVFLSQTGFVLAVGQPCCTDADCTGVGEGCLCEPDCSWNDGNGNGKVDPGELGGNKKLGACGPAGSVIFCPPSTIRSIEGLIRSVTDWIFKIAIIVAPLMLVIGAILFMTAAGNPERIKLGKKIIFWTVIGFLIVLFAEGIINLIDYILGVR